MRTDAPTAGVRANEGLPMRALPTRSRPARSAGIALVLLLAAGALGSPAGVAAASPAPSVVPSPGPGATPADAPATGALPGDHRLLVPATVTLDGFLLPATVADLGVSDPAAALADGSGGADGGDATYLEAGDARRPSLRATLSRAPSGRVTQVRIGLRVRPGAGAASVTTRLRSGETGEATGRAAHVGWFGPGFAAMRPVARQRGLSDAGLTNPSPSVTSMPTLRPSRST